MATRKTRTYEPFWDDRYTVFDPGPYIGEVYAPNAWDTGFISGTQIPGIVQVSAALARHFDVISGPGIEPELQIYGYEALRFTMTVKIWTPIQWALLQDMLSDIQPDSATAFDIYTPWCAVMGIKSAICAKKGPLDGDQVKKLSLELIRWAKGKTKVARVEKSRQRAAEYNADPGPNAPTHGPQEKPSKSPTLTPTP